MPLDYSELLERMSRDLNLLKVHLNSIMRTAPLRYKSFNIDKKNGSTRLVAQPAKEVKAVQRWLMVNVLNGLPVHEAASAYKDGSSIKLNAKAHVASGYMLKVDFERFFPSVKKRDIRDHLSRNLNEVLATDSLEMIAHALTWAPSRKSSLELCIGAPSSPLISNSILFDFDCSMHIYCNAQGVSYTRYADDLTFSCSRKGLLDDVLCQVRLQLRNLEYPRISINERKTVFASRRSRRCVTGIVLTPDHSLSVGRERKRILRARYHKFLLGQLSDKEVESMFGLIAFIEDIEPGFAAKLQKRRESE